jgi:hypothetical protein
MVNFKNLYSKFSLSHKSEDTYFCFMIFNTFISMSHRKLICLGIKSHLRINMRKCFSSGQSISRTWFFKWFFIINQSQILGYNKNTRKNAFWIFSAKQILIAYYNVIAIKELKYYNCIQYTTTVYTTIYFRCRKILIVRHRK